MTFSHSLVLLLVLVLIAGLVLTKVRPVMLFAASALATLALGLVEPPRLLALAANPAVITLLLLLLVSAALEKTGLLALVGRYLFRPGYTMTLARVGAGTVISSAFLNNTAVVAAMAGVVNRQPDHLPSKLLLPLSYAAILGGTLTLVGTSTHLLLNSVLLEQGQPPLALFDFLPVGLAAAFGGLLLLLLLGPGLPSREKSLQGEASYFVDAEVESDSRLVGRTVQQNGLRNLDGLFLAEIIRDGHRIAPVSPDTLIQPEDKLLFCGDISKVGELERFRGLNLFAGANGLLGEDLVEVLLSPTSGLVGRNLKELDFRARFDAAVVGMRRRGVRLSGKLGSIPLQGGDVLVLAVGSRFRDRRRLNRHFYQIGGAELSRPVVGWKEVLAIGGFASVLLANMLLSIPLYIGLATLLMALLGSGVLSSNDIRQRFPFELWVIITSALALAEAFSSTGLAAWLAGQLQANLQTSGVMAAFIGVYFAALLTTELMTNNAAAALVLPLALSLAEAFGVSPMPMIMAVAYGASASFISPFSYQTHMMVMNLGDYRKRDFARVGVPLSMLYSVLVLWLIPNVFPF